MTGSSRGNINGGVWWGKLGYLDMWLAAAGLLHFASGKLIDTSSEAVKVRISRTSVTQSP